MTKESIKTYQYRITQATASQLVVILYDMGIEYLRDACSEEEPAKIQNNIYMAGKVVDQLLVGLDMQYEISGNLFMIYNHIKRTLFVYNEVIKAYPEKIDDVEVMKRMNEEIK